MKHLFLTAMTVAMANVSFADDVPGLKISKSSGDTSVALAEVASIKYTATDMIVNMNDGSQHVIALDDIIVMKFGAVPTAISRIIADANPDATYTIVDLAGKVVGSGKVKKGIAMPAVKGLYTITIGDNTKKLLIK